MNEENDIPEEDNQEERREGERISMEEFFDLMSEETEVPPVLYNSETGEPFRQCSKCKCELTGDVEYFVEKHYNGSNEEDYSPYFEYALCKSCLSGLGIEISSKSRRSIQLLVQEIVTTDLFDKTFSMFPGEEDIEVQTNTCFMSCEPIDRSQEHTIYGQFKGDKMILSSESPRVIGHKGLEMFQNVLSAETKDEMNKIFDIIDLPPELMEDLPKSVFLV